MRLPFPERLPLLPVIVFCLVLCLFQQLQGTTSLFSACTAAFILLATIAFNITGGLTRPSGGFIFAYSVIAVIFGIVYKVLVGEPGQSNLLQPERTVELYVASIAAMLVAAYVARRFRFKKSYLPRFTSYAVMYRGCVGFLFTGMILYLLLLIKGGSFAPGTLLSAVEKFNVFNPLSVMIGVTYQIRKSNGKSSINAAVVAGMILMFSDGVLNYSKEGMLTPFVCWLLPAAAQRYKVNLLQIVGTAIAFSFTVYYLVPYSQYGRNFVVPGTSLKEHINTNIVLLSNLELVRKVYNQGSQERANDEGLFRYYNQPQGLADRIQMISPDDAIIDLTENGTVFGMFPTIFSFENLVPHFIWPEKPMIIIGNIYAHELGILGDEEDESTGISFSPTGDAYHQAKWTGILVLLPLLCFLLFVVADSVFGDTRLSPFALLPLLQYLHGAPEGGITQFSGEAIVGPIEIFIVAFLGAYAMPLLASFVLGPIKEQIDSGFLNSSKTSQLTATPVTQAAVD